MLRSPKRRCYGAVHLRRFHAREDREATVAAVLREQTEGAREEQGCLAIQAYRSTVLSLRMRIDARYSQVGIK
jgi:quinol monooxygenase YgiN